MSVKFDVCIQAPEVTEIGHVSLDVIITMETEVFRLPVLATVLPLQVCIHPTHSSDLSYFLTPLYFSICSVSSHLTVSIYYYSLEVLILFIE